MMVALIDFTFENDCTIEAFETFKLYRGPAWTSRGGVRRPVCYPQHREIRMTATITVGGLNLVPVVLRLHAESVNPPLRFEGVVTVRTPGKHQVNLRLVDGRIEDGASEVSLTLSWSHSTAAASVSIQTVGPITVYQVLACDARQPPPYDLALERACNYVAGGQDPATAICQGIASDIFYDPGTQNDGHTLDLYKTRKGDCNDHAALMKLLCRTIGIGAATVFVWGGKQDRRITYVFNRGGTLLSPTIRITTNRTDGAEKHPHFRLHVQVKVDPGRFFDPSYGTEGLVNVSETAPGAQVKVADALVFPVAHSRWTCPHGARMAPVVRHPQGTEPRPISPNPDELIAGVEISPLIERILPGNTLVGRRPQRYGLAYRFSAAPGGPTHEVAIGLLPTTADASGAFDELKDRSQAPPESLAIGDEGVVWRPLPELDRTGGSLLFRRKNALVYLRGELDQDRREMLASEIDRRFIFSPPDEPWVKRGTPLVPKVSVPASLAIDRHSRPLEMGLRIEYPALDDLIVFTPDVDVARIYDRSTLLFYPPGPGVHQCTIFALTPLNVVGSATVSIEVENPPA